MHNYIVAQTYTRTRAALNQSITEDATSNVMYRYWIPATSLQQITMQGVLNAATNTIPMCWFLPAGAMDVFTFYLARPQEWRVGALYLRAHWSTDVNTGNVSFSHFAMPLVEGTAFSLPSSTTQIVAACTTANGVIVTELGTKDSMEQSTLRAGHLGIYLGVGWDGGSIDDNGGEKSLYGVEVLYREHSRLAGRRN